MVYKTTNVSQNSLYHHQADESEEEESKIIGRNALHACFVPTEES
jgi:hypothetical protein